MPSDDAKRLWALPTVQLAIREASKVYGDLMAQRHEQGLQVIGPAASRSESPIEAVFWIWWQTFDTIAPGPEGLQFRLHPQFDVECEQTIYRLDFAVPEALVAIELDGHEFHEKTKEQVTYRNTRDRRLQALGWTVLHFSGSELFKGEAAVVSSVIEIVEAKLRGDR